MHALRRWIHIKRTMGYAIRKRDRMFLFIELNAEKNIIMRSNTVDLK